MIYESVQFINIKYDTNQNNLYLRLMNERYLKVVLAPSDIFDYGKIETSGNNQNITVPLFSYDHFILHQWSPLKGV